MFRCDANPTGNLRGSSGPSRCTLRNDASSADGSLSKSAGLRRPRQRKQVPSPRTGTSSTGFAIGKASRCGGIVVGCSENECTLRWSDSEGIPKERVGQECRGVGQTETRGDGTEEFSTRKSGRVRNMRRKLKYLRTRIPNVWNFSGRHARFVSGWVKPRDTVR